MPKNKILEGLNPKQKEAATHTEGPLLILAGAGSGKTTVLTRRIAHLIECGVDPGRILAITFTNKAANELKSRIEELLGDRARGVWAMTFHKACVRILRAELPGIGRSGRFSIIDTDDQAKIMRKVLKELDLNEKLYTPSGLLRAISSAKDKLMGPLDYQAEAGTFYETKVAHAYVLYQQKLREQDGMDFDDLIMETVLLFTSHPEVLKKYQERFVHILVDEYQDTNRAQYELTRLLAAGHKRIAVVGDDDQSIYTFRGADIRNILDFEKDYPECKVVRLEQNYRSTQVILDGAFHVVRHNQDRKDKRLWTSREGGSEIVLYVAQSGQDEALLVAQEIEHLLEEGLTYASIAILYRTNAQSRLLEEVFLRRGIPYSIMSGRRFYERKHVKDAVSYMRLVANPKDIAAFERVVNEPARGLGPAAVAAFLTHSREQGVDLIESLRAAPSIKGLNASQKRTAHDLGEILSAIAKEKDRPPHYTLHDLLNKTGYLSALEARATAESQSRLDDLDELVASVRTFAVEGGDLEAYLEQCALVSDQDSYDEALDAVVMGTLHSAKGLEFTVVFLVGMEEGILPHARSTQSEGEIEEERRLLYVGMTRAKKHLYMSFAQSRDSRMGHGRTIASRFLAEIPLELLDIRRWED